MINADARPQGDAIAMYVVRVETTAVAAGNCVIVHTEVARTHDKAATLLVSTLVSHAMLGLLVLDTSTVAIDSFFRSPTTPRRERGVADVAVD